MKITERQVRLLDTIVQEYIYSARPISSQLLTKKYEFGICPATIRNEMQALTEAEYLIQPHTSAGRIPTDKAYRFFVDNQLEKEISDFNDLLIGQLIQGGGHIFEFIDQLTKSLAETCSGLVVSSVFEKDLIFKQGWEGLFQEPEFEDKDFVLNFMEFLKEFEKDIRNLEINSEIKIYIGKEGPFAKSKDFSIILSKCDFPKKQQGIISILGPKRMPYKENINLINSIVKILEKY